MRIEDMQAFVLASTILENFVAQFGVALCVMGAMIFVAAMIYVFLIKRHSLAATAGFVFALIVGGLVIGSAIHFLLL
jgi:hypothetical protein